jgi:hypothetical protein
MNDRIKELIMEAVNFRLDPDSDAYEAQICPEDLEYLAELIVKVCIREIGYKSVELLDIDFYPHYQERLKKYFGVEE